LSFSPRLVEHPPSVAIVALDGDDVMLVRQWRPGAPERTLEVPAGTLEDGETPEQAAVRELAEECSLAAARWHRLGDFLVVPAYSTERIHAFAATDLSLGAGAAADADEDIEVERVPAEAAWRHVSDATSLATLALWSRWSARAA
jgi:ADP-ribose pyrophosphatase